MGMETTPATTSQWTKFEIDAPEATEVTIVGNFAQGYRLPIRMRREAAGKWHTALRLPPGWYEYHYVVDGRRVPAAEAGEAGSDSTQEAVYRMQIK
jgi:1,4-alpha-glucan branching enzyme